MLRFFSATTLRQMQQRLFSARDRRAVEPISVIRRFRFKSREGTLQHEDWENMLRTVCRVAKVEAPTLLPPRAQSKLLFAFGDAKRRYPDTELPNDLKLELLSLVENMSHLVATDLVHLLHLLPRTHESHDRFLKVACHSPALGETYRKLLLHNDRFVFDVVASDARSNPNNMVSYHRAKAIIDQIFDVQTPKGDWNHQSSTFLSSASALVLRADDLTATERWHLLRQYTDSARERLAGALPLRLATALCQTLKVNERARVNLMLEYADELRTDPQAVIDRLSVGLISEVEEKQLYAVEHARRERMRLAAEDDDEPREHNEYDSDMVKVTPEQEELLLERYCPVWRTHLQHVMSGMEYDLDFELESTRLERVMRKTQRQLVAHAQRLLVQ